ncbi:6-pyruvoyl trahydropterin synthase family protein [Lichenicola sp.]|uniref:6-pyruvoyl trahydropterin synthase family protein n=1 Tax=Lichenicola sp. TaxID=2804529 RepID=UPI003AFFE8BA
MLELCFTRRFSMGHRLIGGQSERCALPHGHNEFVTATLQPVRPARLDGVSNMLVPFEQAKARWHCFVDERLDHALQLSDTDPLLAWFRANEPGRAERIVVTPGDPTTELMACLLMAKLSAILLAEGGLLRVAEIRIEETPTNTVAFSGDPSEMLPQFGPGTEGWWQRADMSIA